MMFRPIIVLFLAILFTLGGCASFMGKQAKTEEKLVVKKYTVTTGEALKISYPFSTYVEGAQFICKWGNFPAYYEGLEYHAYVAESYFTEFTPYTCDLVVGTQKLEKIIEIEVNDRTFPEEQLRVEPKRIYLSMKDQLRVRNEQAMLKVVFDDTAASPLFDQPFIMPMDSKITSHYGVRRLFNGSKKGQHLGTDFRAQIGVPVPVANNGRVVFTGDLFYTGNTVIIDHGVGIFTIYGHLNSIKSELGEYIPRGGIIGKSGATGRVSGPHLHWGVKVGGNYIDGVSLIRETTPPQGAL